MVGQSQINAAVRSIGVAQRRVGGLDTRDWDKMWPCARLIHGSGLLVLCYAMRCDEKRCFALLPLDCSHSAPTERGKEGRECACACAC